MPGDPPRPGHRPSPCLPSQDRQEPLCPGKATNSPSLQIFFRQQPSPCDTIFMTGSTIIPSISIKTGCSFACRKPAIRRTMKDVERRGRRKVYAAKSALAGLLALSMGTTNVWAGVTIGEGGSGYWNNPYFYALANGETATNTTPIKHGESTGPIIDKLMADKGYLSGIMVGSGSLNNEGEIHLYFKNETGDVRLYGIEGDTSRNGADIELRAEVGTATSTPAKASAFAYGIQGEVGSNEGKMIIKVEGGTASSASTYAHAYAYAYAYAYGIRGEVGDNIGHMTIKAEGGKVTSNATGTAYATAYAKAYGIWGNVTNNSGAMEIRAQGSKATSKATDNAFADTSAVAYAIRGTVGSNEGKMSITAQGGEDEATSTAQAYAQAYDQAYGIWSGVKSNIGKMGIKAQGGTATSNATNIAYAYTPASAYGIKGGVGNNSGEMEISAQGGTATSTTVTAKAKSFAHAYAKTYGIEGEVGDNRGKMEIGAEGGTASAYSWTDAEANAIVSAHGIEGKVGKNSGEMKIRAQGGRATAEATVKALATASADALGIRGQVGKNSKEMKVKATGGTAKTTTNATTASASANAYARASASAHGIFGGMGGNSGNMTIRSLGGKATAYDTAFANAMVDAIAYGIRGQVRSNEGKMEIETQGGTAEATAAKATTSANAWAYGIEGEVGDNDGKLEIRAQSGEANANATGTGTADAWADAYGIRGTVGSNGGKMTITAQSDTATATTAAKAKTSAYAQAYGIEGRIGDNIGHMVIKAQGGKATSKTTGTAWAWAWADAYGIDGGVGSNEGKMTIRAQGGEAEATAADANAYTIAAAHGIEGKVEKNSGEMEIRAQGGTTNATTTTNAKASADASARAFGIEGQVGSNEGNMNIGAQGGEAEATAAETTAYGNADARAKAYATASAYGIIGGVGSNEGKMTITATGGKANGHSYISSYAFASGIEGDVGKNSGEMEIRAEGGTATTTGTGTTKAYARAIGIGSSADLYNEGQLEVMARAGRYSTDGGTTYQSDSARAVGISFSGEAELDSRALISVSALPAQDEAGKAIALGTGKTLHAYQVYSGEDLSIKGYAMKFNNQAQVTADYKGTIGVAEGKRVTFAPDAQVYAFTDNDFGKVPNYSIPMLVEGETRRYNQFSAAQLVVSSPDYSISLLDSNGGTLQRLAIKYTPEVSTPLVSAQVNQKMLASGTTIVTNNSLSPMLAMMDRSNPQTSAYDGVLLASTSPVLAVPDMEILPQKRGWAFAMPYYSNVSNNASPMGYDADIYGATAGYNHWIDSDLILGFHAGYGSGDINYTGKGYEQKKENLKAGSLGVQSLYRFADDWLLQSIASFYYSSNDYSDNNPLNREQGDYHGYGVNANLDLDYVFSFTNNRLVPSVGLRYLWQHVDSYTAYNLDNADIHYGDMDENQLYANLGLDWYGDYQTESNWQIVPSLGLGIEQALTDNKFGNSMGVGSIIIPVTNSMDKTSVSARASIEFVKDSYALSAGYAGAYSNDTKNSSFYLQMKYFF
ncbi:hypothetical protein DP2471 [Desulfotalea psychrophila LSv54]|uniref:Autotransporter domain-containing protein n=2 Tax=Desulfotalea psychrophila TaxID=84980 RepID=Q6AKC5_DESPS|nr:hypothetical protein DP2471 [Desulfotalea psychrophila LSv54]